MPVFNYRACLVGVGVGLAAGGFWIFSARGSDAALIEKLEADHFEFLARELWAPRISRALEARRPLGESVGAARRTPELAVLRVYDRQGRSLLVAGGPARSGGVLHLWAPLRLAGRAPSLSQRLKRVGTARLVYSSQGGLISLKVLDLKGRVISEPVARRASAYIPSRGLHVLEASLYVGEFHPVSSPRGFLRLSYTGAGPGGFTSYSLLDHQGRTLERTALGVAESGVPSKLRGLRLPLPARGGKASPGRLEVEYAVPQDGARAMARVGEAAGLAAAFLLALFLVAPASTARRFPLAGKDLADLQAGAELSALGRELASIRELLESRSPGLELSSEQGREVLERLDREKDRFVHALQHERLFRTRSLGVVVRELRGLQRSILGMARAAGNTSLNVEIMQCSRELLSIIADAEILTDLPPFSPPLQEGSKEL